MNRLATTAGLLLVASSLVAQDPQTLPTKETKWKSIGEIGIAAADNNVVAAGSKRMLEFIAAGVADGEKVSWTSQSFMTAQTLAAVPLRLRFLRDVKETGQIRKGPFLIFDHESKIDFGAMFADMGAQPLQGEHAWDVRGMQMCSVRRPDGGYRLNFGGRNIFGKAGTSPLFTTYTEITAKLENEKLMSRLRQMPIYASFDFRTVLSDREKQELIGIFGPRAGLVSGSITTMGGRPALDLYSAIRAGDGLVGPYMAKQPGQARILGALNFEPKIIFAADLGKQVPRTVLALARSQAKDGDMRDVLEPLFDLLEVWTGELTLVATGVAPPAQTGKNDLDEVSRRLGKSFAGTLSFGVEEGTGADIVTSLEKFLASDDVSQSAFGIEPVEENGRRAFRMAGGPFQSIGVKHISFGAGENLFVVSVADTAAKSLDHRDGTLKKQGTVRTPKRLGFARGPVKLWVHHDMSAYVTPWMSFLREWPFGDRFKNRVDWMEKAVGDLLSENVALSLTWSNRTGAMLRALF